MAFNPITVNKGPSAEPHIYAEDDASIFQCMFGEDGILDIGSKLELSIQSNNLVRMSDGVLCIGGHIGRVKYADYADLTIDNGETGYNRNDLIIGSFSNTGEHTIDTFEPQVIKGTPATGDAVDPTLTEGSLYEGDHLRQRAIARVKLEGLNIVGIDMLLPVIPSIPSLKALLDELNGKMTEIGVEQSYSENGWSVSYRSIGANRVYFITSKTVSSIVAGGNQLEIAALPFKVAFEQHIYLAMNVSGTPVGYGYTRIVPTSGSGNTSAMYRHCAGYSNAVTMLAFGELVIQ